MSIWFFDAEKKVGVQVNCTEQHHQMFEKALVDGTSSDAVRLYLEKGYVVTDVYNMLKKLIENNPVNEDKNIIAFHNYLDKITRSILQPGQRYILGAEIIVCNSIAEKYGLLTGVTIRSDAKYHTYYIPKLMKEYMTKVSRDLNTNISHILLDFCYTGMVFQQRRKEQEENPKKFIEEYDERLLFDLRQLDKTRISKFENNDGRFTIQLGEYNIKKKHEVIIPRSMEMIKDKT